MIQIVWMMVEMMIHQIRLLQEQEEVEMKVEVEMMEHNEVLVEDSFK